MKKRFIALFLALVMVMTSLPLAGFAATGTDSRALTELMAQAEEALKNDKGEHTFIVQVKDPSAFSNSRRNSRSASQKNEWGGSKNSLNSTVDENVIDARLASQDRLLDEILGSSNTAKKQSRSMFSTFSQKQTSEKIVTTYNKRNNIRHYRAVINGFL